MAEPLVVALVAALLLAGAACGHGEYLLRRMPRLGAERARTLAMIGSLGLATAGCAAAVAAAVAHLAGCQGGGGCARSVVVARLDPPVTGLPKPDLTLQIDGLAALFVVVVGCCAAGVAVYSFGWLRDDPLRHGVAGTFNLYVLATMFAVLVSNVFWLFVALELITLCCADLVRYQGRRGGPLAANRTAVRTYLLVSHAGLICLLAGLLPVVVSGDGALDFRTLHLMAGSSPVPAVSFALVLLGLAIRAGVTPFHFWVPAVHPQLPTNTHAMMSAVMLKIPVYLMIRFFCGELIGPVQWWWGVTLLVLAGVTALVTVFYALLGKDLKTVLAYHSVENIGIILAGVGMALLFADPRFDDTTPVVRGAAALALLASLYHVVNHALFKTLLFLGTGSIERRTGTVETGALGGLLRRAPWTGVTFLVGATAIAGLPPLNGFISEWLTLQSLFAGQAPYRGDAVIALIAMTALVIALVTLAVAFAMTALAFLKIAGEALLGAPHGGNGSGNRGTGNDGGNGDGDGYGGGNGNGGETWSMRVVLAAFAGACLLIGLQPWLLVPWLRAAVGSLGYDAAVLDASATALTVDLAPTGQGAYRAVLPILPLVLLAVVPLLLTAGIRAAGWVRRPVWVGGEPFEPRRMQYTGTAVTALLWYPVASERAAGRDAPLPARFRLGPRRGVTEPTNRLYNHLVAGITGGSQRFGQRFQNGDIRSYLLYIFAAVMLVLVALAVSR